MGRSYDSLLGGLDAHGGQGVGLGVRGAGQGTTSGRTPSQGREGPVCMWSGVVGDEKVCFQQESREGPYVYEYGREGYKTSQPSPYRNGEVWEACPREDLYPSYLSRS